jgi:tripartite-type tricarboxylate transporter receptor subunit TctC
MKRRTLIGAGAGLGVMALSRAGIAEDLASYPSKPVRIVVGFPPGQASDVVARIIAAKLGEEFNQSFIVDNKPGAAGIVAHEAVKSTRPDGYTLLIGSTATLAVNPTLYRQLSYDPLKDFTPISGLTATPMYLMINPGLPITSVRELVAYVRARPGRLSYPSAGSGTSSHIVMEMFKKQNGLDLVHVPFKGAPAAMISLQSGDTPIAFDIASVIAPHATAGKVKILATTAAQRTSQFPEVPTLVEEGLPGFVFVPWSAILAPAGTPGPIVEKLNAAVNRALKSKEMAAYLGNNTSSDLGGTPDALASFMRDEIERWGNAVRVSGAKVD